LSMQDNRAWSRNYMDALMAVRVVNRTAGFKAAGPPDAEELVRRFLEAPRAFIFLDYDGTIVPLADRPDQAVPSDRVLDLLRDMASIPSFRLCIVSGREKHVPLDVTFAAEHGACVRHAGEPDCVHLVDDSAFRDRRENVLGIMRDFQRRIPGSTIEEKEFGLVWHYRMADPIFAQQQALVLADALGGLLQRTSLGVMIAKKAVEVTHMGINKGDAVRVVLDHEKFDPKADVLLTVGDDRTDDDMFRVYANSNISIGVSDTPLLSSYTMEQSELVDLLTDLTRRARGRQYRLWAGQR
ncbi:MAG: trehalose-phosphatase, partial [Candidatus Binatia bacterium]